MILFFILEACNNKPVEKPVWLNKKNILFIPQDSLLFKAGIEKWEAYILSFTQPIPLQIQYHKEGFTLLFKNRNGVTEGPARLVLKNGSNYFFYDVSLQNTIPGLLNNNDYRSPKTVNVDSGLVQQQIRFTIDEWRNILDSPLQQQTFNEQNVQLPFKAGVYRSQADNPLSSFYVQPGSSRSMIITATYLSDEHVFEAIAGPLTDTYNNTLANGTQVAFIYHDGERTFRMETALNNGYASVKIPGEKNKYYQLLAKVNEHVFKQIQLFQK